MMNEDIIKKLLSENTEDSIRERVDNQLHEYVDDDWEDDYESEYDWYVDHCNGEAESDILREVINAGFPNLSSDNYCIVFDALKETWTL